MLDDWLQDENEIMAPPDPKFMFLSIFSIGNKYFVCLLPQTSLLLFLFSFRFFFPRGLIMVKNTAKMNKTVSCLQVQHYP